MTDTILSGLFFYLVGWFFLGLYFSEMNNVIYNSVKLVNYRWGREQEPAEAGLEWVE